MSDTVYEVYAKVDPSGRIIGCDGGITKSNIQNLSEWVKIDDGTGTKYAYCQSNYFRDGLYTDDGIPRYKLLDGTPVHRTPEEMEADRVPLRAEEARRKRDKLLAETDWTQTLDAPVTQESKIALRAYRQELRDLPEKEGWPASVAWPEIPKIIKGVPDGT